MDNPSTRRNRPGRRPSTAEQGVATRRALLDAAAALVAESGWCAVTTRAIAARAGVPHGAVSYHFAGKEELLREAALAATRQALAAPAAFATQAGSVAELLEGTFAWYAAGGLADPAVAQLLETARQAARDPLLRAPIAAELHDYRKALADLVRRDQQRGALAAGVPADGVAAAIAALLDGLILHLVLDPDLDTQPAAAAVLGLLAGEPR
ncbi:TetR/AcrR family transcriptional regulator [Actinocrinis puniceicyclus]|uniref:TetR/AcrR family transcriptional regulator n=1 Tax=Actinocrinis puniceicyclus TaxID=977794 RepID=A0A8J7WLL7_9ACTN|nr:TetR/AcrR family transcriptional regulator [Actinocrinis puniceicyclus]MBS2964633.1 TetR/AcrR family transcriptional regulator [Actinocrinis puniceicyclus]